MSASNTTTIQSKKPKTVVGFFKNFDEVISYISDEATGLYSVHSVVIILKDINEINKIKYFLLLDGYIVSEIRSITNFEIKNNALNLGLMQHIKGLIFDYVFIVDLADHNVAADRTDKNKDNYYLSHESYLQFTLMANKGLYLLSSGNPAKYLSEIADEEIIEKIGSPEDPAEMIMNTSIFDFDSGK